MKRLTWLNLSAAWLLLLLQRTPMVRILSSLGEAGPSSRIVSLLKGSAAGLASLGAVHSLAGATEFVVSNSNVFGTVGTPIMDVTFEVNGAMVPAGSFQIFGPLPPGVTGVDANANGIINSSKGTIRGTPTAAGTYTINLVAWEKANATGDAIGPTNISFIITATATSGPSIVTHPASATIPVGANASLTVVAAGSPAPTYQWRKNGTLVPGATSATISFSNAQASDSGAYTVVVSNLAGLVTSNAATLTVTTVGPVIATQPQSQYLTPGADAVLSVAANGAGLAYQWKKDGAPIAGATTARHAIASATAESMGFYSATVTDSGGSTDSAVAIVTVNTGGTSRLVNVSTRGYVPAGGALTPGFVLQGDSTKSVVIRGVGPTLGSFGVSGTLADPVMDVIPLGSATAIASNDNWGGASALVSAFTRVGAFPLAASNSSDASVAASLSATGATGYTVRITSRTTSGAGIALAEVYDEEPLGSPVRLVNVSTSGFVGTGDQALVPGFFIGGAAPKQLLIRAVGPGLAQFGVTEVLGDPQLSLAPLGKAFAVATNDNWGGSAALQAAFTQAGAFALSNGSNDAAILVRLPPGGYTVVVSGIASTTGTALVEIYDLDR